MSQTLAIIDYGSGNLKSAAKAFERAALEAELDTKIIVTADPSVVAKSDRIVLPGVGAFADCRDGLFAVPGMVDALNQRVVAEAAPFLGICVGLQLMASRGLEKGVHAGLDWVAGDVDLIRPTDPALKVPHMGWNTLDLQTEHPIFAGIALGPVGLHCYFTHSYHFAATDPESVLATADYGGPITAAIARDNMVGTQFHPEKSQAMGLALISNFLRWRP